MRTSQLLKRNLSYYWRTNLAVVAGVATAVAVLAGSTITNVAHYNNTPSKYNPAPDKDAQYLIGGYSENGH